MSTQTITAPAYKAWTHPGTGEVRYYINNIWDIATARRGKAWLAGGELHTSDDMHYTTVAKIRAAVEAHPLPTQQARGGALGAPKSTDTLAVNAWLTRMMDSEEGI